MYVFERPGSGWANATQTAELTASDGRTAGRLLGRSRSRCRAIRSSSEHPCKESACPTTSRVRRMCLKSRGRAGPTRPRPPSSPPQATSRTILGTRLRCRATRSSSEAGSWSAQHPSGVVYVFEKPGSGWAERDPDRRADRLGRRRRRLPRLLGCRVGRHDRRRCARPRSARTKHEGAAYVFEEPGSGWADATQTAELTASDGAEHERRSVIGRGVGRTRSSPARGTTASARTKNRVRRMCLKSRDPAGPTRPRPPS